jgi:hypothetical protein
MMMNKHLAVFVLTALVGCGDAETPTGWDPVADDPETAWVTPDPAGLSTSPIVPPAEPALFISNEFSAQTPPQDAHSFALTDTDSLYFYVYLPDVAPGSHVVVLEVIRPDGYLHDTLYAPFDVGSAVTRGGVLTEMGWRLVLELPVAGTAIDEYSLTGTWSTHVLLDVVAGPALYETTFDLTQPIGR